MSAFQIQNVRIIDFLHPLQPPKSNQPTYTNFDISYIMIILMFYVDDDDDNDTLWLIFGFSICLLIGFNFHSHKL